MFGFTGKHHRHHGKHHPFHAAAFGEDGPLGGSHRGGFGGGPFGGGQRGGGPFNGGRRGKRFEGEELRLIVLGLLAQESQHGYQLIRAIGEKSGGAYQPSPGVLYPLLAMLADMGLVAEAESAGSRRSFALTDTGKAEATEKSAQIEALFARLAAMADASGKPDAAPVRRAVHNLRSAIVERLEREIASPEHSRDLAFEIARIIDEATQKIERLP
jgi:DNA-binding PadR family transcriptional regulator